MCLNLEQQKLVRFKSTFKKKRSETLKLSLYLYISVIKYDVITFVILFSGDLLMITSLLFKQYKYDSVYYLNVINTKNDIYIKQSGSFSVNDYKWILLFN